MKRLNIGCGNNILDDYINIDIRDVKPNRLFGDDYLFYLDSPNDSIKKLLFDFYDQHPCLYPLRKDYLDKTKQIHLLYPGLGDAVIMTTLPYQITATNNRYLNDLLKYSNKYNKFIIDQIVTYIYKSLTYLLIEIYSF